MGIYARNLGTAVRLQAGLAIHDSGVIRKPQDNEHEPLKSNETFLWRARENLPETVFFFLLYRMLLDLPDSYGQRMVAVGIGLDLSTIAIASSRRGRHRKVRSRSRSEQRIRRNFAVEIWVF